MCRAHPCSHDLLVTILLENAKSTLSSNSSLLQWVLVFLLLKEKTCHIYMLYCFRGTVVGSEESVSDFGKDFEEILGLFQRNI